MSSLTRRAIDLVVSIMIGIPMWWINLLVDMFFVISTHTVPGVVQRTAKVAGDVKWVNLDTLELPKF